MGLDNASPAAKPTHYQSGNFRFAAPKSIHLLRQHRLTPYPTLCASLEAY